MTELPINQVLCGAFPAATRAWPDGKINMVMFSPPYWGLRDYGEATNIVWGGDPGCEHDWVSQKVYKDSPTRRSSSEKWTRADGTTENADKLKEARWNESSFCSKCGAWFGQLGLEPTYQMYVYHLVEVGREIRRILRKDGSWYLNLGDTYSSQGGPQVEQTKNASHGIPPIQPNRKTNIPAKCKLLIPYRVALALIDDGWICRNDITWHKPNSMPSSVKDRLNCTTEKVFHLVKSNKAVIWRHKVDRGWQTEKPRVEDRIACTNCNGTGQDVIRKEPCRCLKTKFPRTEWAWRGFDYYYDLDAIREPHSTATIKRATQPTVFEQQGGAKQDELNPITGRGGNYNRPAEMVKSIAKNLSRGKNPGDVVQQIQPQYPPHHRARITEGDIGTANWFIESHYAEGGRNPGDFCTINTRPFPEAHFAVYPGELCVRPIKSSCPPNGIVLDPMCGAGTTLKEAKRLGRRYIGIDIKPEYVEMTKRGLSQVERPLEAYSL